MLSMSHITYLTTSSWWHFYPLKCDFILNWPIMKFDSLKQRKEIQAALIIRGLGIRGFDYSRVRKQGKPANNKGIL